MESPTFNILNSFSKLLRKERARHGHYYRRTLLKSLLTNQKILDSFIKQIEKETKKLKHGKKSTLHQ